MKNKFLSILNCFLIARYFIAFFKWILNNEIEKNKETIFIEKVNQKLVYWEGPWIPPRDPTRVLWLPSNTPIFGEVKFNIVLEGVHLMFNWILRTLMSVKDDKIEDLLFCKLYKLVSFHALAYDCALGLGTSSWSLFLRALCHKVLYLLSYIWARLEFKIMHVFTHSTSYVYYS